MGLNFFSSLYILRILKTALYMIIKKSVLFLAVAVIVLMFGLSIVYVVQVSKSPADNVILYKDSHLTDVDKKPFVDRIAENEKKLSALTGDNDAPQRFQLNMGLASDYYALGEYGKALPLYKDAARLFPKEASAWNSLAGLEVHMGDIAAAREHYQKATSVEPTNPEYWRASIDLLRFHFGYGKEQVLAEIQKALTATNGHVDMITYEARYLADDVGDLEAAVKSWKLAKEKSPANQQVFDAEIQALQARLQ